MSFVAYLYLLRSSLIKYFNSKESTSADDNKTKYALEVYTENKYEIQSKCKKAALEIRYISGFTHWPIAKAKVKTANNSLVYLDVSRGKRASLEQRNKRDKRDNQTLTVTKKTTTATKVPAVKEIPNH